LVDGENLHEGFLEKLAPYAKLQVGYSVQKSNVLKGAGGKHPQWQQDFEFHIIQGEDLLSMEIWDQCPISDNFVGYAKISLADAFKGLVDKKYEITNREGHPSGHIRLVMRFEDQEPGSLPTPAPQPVAPTPQPAPFPQGGYPPAQGGYPYPPPAQGGYPYPPPAQGGYPPAQGGYPPAQGGYPPAQGGYPSTQGGYPSTQGQPYPQQPAYSPPAQPAYSPPPQPAYSPPPQPAYSPPPQPAYSPPPQPSYSPPAQPAYAVQPQTQYDEDYEAVPVRQPPRFIHHHGGHPLNVRAVEGSQDRNGEIQIVVRIHHNGSIQPGKYPLNREHAYFSYYGSELSSQKFEILEDDSNNYAWILCNNANEIPMDKVVPIGREAEGQTLYSARALFNGTFHVGKAGAHITGASIPFSGREEYVTPFEVLVYKN